MIISNGLRAAFIVAVLYTLTCFSAPVVADELKDITQMAEQGQQDAALARINGYLASNPNDAQGLFTKGIILAESGKREDALKTFTELTQKYPNLPEPYNNLAVLYAEAGQYDLAKKALETAIKTHPSYAIAHENLGDIYARMASEAYDKALKLDNSNSRAQSKLSLIKNLFTSTNTAIAANTATPVAPVPVAPVNKASNVSNTLPIRPADKKIELAKPVVPVKPPAEVVATAEPSSDAINNSNEENAITELVNNWANAWAKQNLNQYFASYADSFKPGNGENRSSWEKTRRERITRPKKITITLDKQKVTIEDAQNATVTFVQHYRADGRPYRTDKTLKLKKANHHWLIDEEIASD